MLTSYQEMGGSLQFTGCSHTSSAALYIPGMIWSHFQQIAYVRTTQRLAIKRRYSFGATIHDVDPAGEQVLHDIPWRAVIDG
ncbi:hypothetical protein VTN77DRAFT_583 [Rasamsonia byssochlamydoides]|uniref:uncharacterized protein n=1 Tax=Rasamsonia byssochlamydoides TaxID=89139 RepID=UPI00374245C9